MLLKSLFISLDKYFCCKKLQLAIKLVASLINLCLSTQIPKLGDNVIVGMNCISFTLWWIKRSFLIDAPKRFYLILAKGD